MKEESTKQILKQYIEPNENKNINRKICDIYDCV